MSRRKTGWNQKTGRRLRVGAAALLVMSMLSAGAVSAADTDSDSDSVKVTEKSLHFAADWQEILEALQSAENYYRYDDIFMVEEATVDAVPSADAAGGTAETTSSAADSGAAKTAGEDYSTTNLREAAVDEADVVKTDGDYIYSLTDDTLLIVRADGSDSEPVSYCRAGALRYGRSAWEAEEDAGEIPFVDLIEVEDYSSVTPKEMFVDGDRLILIREINVRRDDYNSDIYYYSSYVTHTSVDTYDISDRSEPVLLGTMEQQGSYRQSRKNGSILYLYTAGYPSVGSDLSSSDLSVTVNGEELGPDQFCVPDLVTDEEYLIVSSVDIQEPSETIDHKVYISGAEDCYVTADHLYVLTSYYNYSTGGTKTEIASFKTTDGQIAGQAAASIRGYVNDTWSVDEHDGYLRVLTTYTGPTVAGFLESLMTATDLSDILYWYDSQTWVRRNALIVLDEDLKKVGALYNLAKNEEIRSARYFGDTVYFVTYRNTDPLFCVDLSDPENPSVQSELKVTGFSSYLHPYGDGRLLGIGYETDEYTGSTLGVKLSMFDTSERGELTELSRIVLPGITSCPSISRYKAILADAGKNLIGFYCNERYFVFSFDEETGFNRELLYDYYSDNLSGTTDYQDVRGLYIGDEFYIAGGDSVIGFDLAADFEKILVLSVG